MSSATPAPGGTSRSILARRIARGLARLLAAAGLAVDAYVHAHLADQYDFVGDDITQGTLFRIEAALASLAALLVVVWHRKLVDAFAWLVAAGGLALILIYRWDDVGTLGPFPNMYEPLWYGYKTTTVVSQGVAVIATTYLLVTHTTRSRTSRHGHRRRGLFGRWRGR